ncbi:hybrid sensor histidine kinase/response regulator [Desulfovibrio inopinatus]|uniref:hybrid sensor histidine kinase/response regulator n=1 Tax=Desulfovibrio inopinatus TaxID=102109 RepID=UPI0004179986|nr:hybrid sensor histidine kinase/response regulator [Desulfovibrio inopinatus]
MNRKVILCVDDEKIVLESLRSELEEHFSDDYDLEFAESGGEALEVIADLVATQDQLALIITDYLMPGLKGDEILATIFQQHPESKQIMLTGQANLEGITNAINNAKLYRYISKPWEKSDLLLTITEAVKSYEQEMQIKEHHVVLEETVRRRTRELEQTLMDLKSSQEQLVAAEKMAVLGGLVAGIAHEINTPVGVGVTAASHLENQLQDIVRQYRNAQLSREEYEQFLDNAVEGIQIILRNLEAAANLVSSFKLVAVDQSSEALREFKFNEYLKAILLSLQPEIKQTRIKITVDCPESLMINSYPGDFSQIFTNLIMNSILHGFNNGRDPGTITISVMPQDNGTITIDYADTGKGIPPDIIPQIFDPFFTTNRQSGRSGLGMHIVYNIVTHRLKGSVVCKDRPPQGAHFLITVPSNIQM